MQCLLRHEVSRALISVAIKALISVDIEALMSVGT